MSALVSVLAVLGAKNSDTFWHILIGQDVVNRGITSGVPELTFGKHYEWLNTEVVFEVFAYFLFRTVGVASLPIWSAFFVAISVAAAVVAAYMVLPKRLRFASIPVGALFSLLLIHAADADWLAARPVGFSVAASIIFGAVIFRTYRTGRVPNPLYAFAGIALWTVLHGGSLLAAPLFVVVLALRWVAVRTGVLPVSLTASGFRKSAVTVAAMVAGTFVNPVGVDIYFVAAHIRETCMGLFFEWGYPSGRSLTIVALVALVFLLVSIPALKNGRKRVVMADALFFLTVMATGASTNRTLYTAVLMASIVLVRPMATLMPKFWRTKMAPRQLSVAFIAIILGAALATAVTKQTVYASPKITVGLANTADERKVWVPIMENGVVQFVGQGRISTYMDGRLDRYGRELLETEALRYQEDVEVSSNAMTDPIALGMTDVVTTNPALVDFFTEKGWRVACVENQHHWLTSLPTGECGSDNIEKAISSVPIK